MADQSYENLALLIAIDAGGTGWAIAALGDRAIEETKEWEANLDEMGLDNYPHHPGIYVWKGKLVVTEEGQDCWYDWIGEYTQVSSPWFEEFSINP